MKIVNVDGIKELECKETDYWSLLNFFKSFDKQWYDERDIYCEAHHIYPRSEMGVEIPIIIYLPFRYHFLAHYYRAKENIGEIEKLNYLACSILLGVKRNRLRLSELDNIAKIFPQEYYDIKTSFCNKFNAMSKKVINLETLEIYPTVSIAAKSLNLDRHIIGNIVNYPDNYYKNSVYKTHYLAYYSDDKDMGFYKNLYQYYSSIPKRKKKPLPRESIESASIKRTGQHFVQKESKKIKDNYTGIIYDSTTKAGEALNIDRHKVLKSCREKRPLVVKGKEYFFSFLEEANEV